MRRRAASILPLCGPVRPAVGLLGAGGIKRHPRPLTAVFFPEEKSLEGAEAVAVGKGTKKERPAAPCGAVSRPTDADRQ